MTEDTFPLPSRFQDRITDILTNNASLKGKAGVLFTGSSTMRIWGKTLAEDFEHFTVIPAGFGGATLIDLLHYMPQFLKTFEPASIVIYAGGHDIRFGHDANQVLVTFKQLIALIKEHNETIKITYLSIKPFPKRFNQWPESKIANALIAEACSASGINYIDIATALLNTKKTCKVDLFEEDMIHLNAKGYQVINRIVRAGLVVK